MRRRRHHHRAVHVREQPQRDPLVLDAVLEAHDRRAAGRGGAQRRERAGRVLALGREQHDLVAAPVERRRRIADRDLERDALAAAARTSARARGSPGSGRRGRSAPRRARPGEGTRRPRPRSRRRRRRRTALAATAASPAGRPGAAPRRPRRGGAPASCTARSGRPPGSSRGLAQDLGHDLGEPVERLLGLGLGRLDQQRLVDDQREVHGRRVHAVVEQPLGEVERLDAAARCCIGAPESTNSCMHSRS